MVTYETVFAVVLAYLIGSVPTAVWYGKLFYGIDVRTMGSGNAGATNTIRVLGWKAGLPVLLVDVCKGWFAVYLSYLLNKGITTSEQLVIFQIVLGIIAVTGHVFPVFAGFRGGKGVATLLGVGIALYPMSMLVCPGLFILMLVISKYVSLSSIATSVAFPLIEIFLFGQTSLPLIILSVGVAIFIPVTHRKNIQRLIRGEERKFTLKRESK